MSRYQSNDPYQEGYDAFWKDDHENPYSGESNRELWELGFECAESEYWEEMELGEQFITEF